MFSHRERKRGQRAIWQFGRVGKKARRVFSSRACRAHVSSHSPLISREKNRLPADYPNPEASNIQKQLLDLVRNIITPPRDRVQTKFSPSLILNNSLFTNNLTSYRNKSKTQKLHITTISAVNLSHYELIQ